MESLATYTVLDVLQGNLISCDTVPSHDQIAYKYLCGSQTLSESIISWGIFSIVFVSLCLACLYIGTLEPKGLENMKFLLTIRKLVSRATDWTAISKDKSIQECIPNTFMYMVLTQY